MKKNSQFIEILKGIGIMALYFLLPLIITIPFYFLNYKKIINLNNNTTYEIYMLVEYLILLLTITLIYFKDLKKDFKDFKKNYKSYLKIAFKYWFIGYSIMIISSTLISYLNINETINQESNIASLKNYPLFEIITACFIAPIIEELVFRKSLRKGIKNNKNYIIITSIIFSFIHVSTSLSTNPLSLIHLIPYGALSVALAKTYTDTNNIFSNISIHIFHNTLAIIELLLLGV